MIGNALMREISRQIWDMKYRFKAADGTPMDRDVADSWTRVAASLALAEAPERRIGAAQSFAAALKDFKFLPAGRILAGAGTGRAVTLFNCFVMGTIPDSMDGIFAVAARSGADAAARRRHRLRLFHLAASGRAGGRCGRRCLRPRLLHGGVGCDVPHHHERWLAGAAP